MVRWPVLKLGFDRDTRERANDTPRYPERYGWGNHAEVEYEWYVKNKEVMKFIDKLLLEASMLPPVRRTGGLRASIQSWKKLGDEAY